MQTPRLVTVGFLAPMLFLIGRITFFAGYARGAATRSFGFALTFYPSVMLLVLNLVYWGRMLVAGGGHQPFL